MPKGIPKDGRIITLKECQDKAKEREGKCLSESYSNIYVKMEWECKHGHKFTTNFNQIKFSHTWCPHCSFSVSTGEVICKAAMEAIFRVPFEKERPKWLVTEKKTLLELDGVNHNLKIAFEYNGSQHYLPTSFTGYDSKDERERKLVDRREKDLLKAEICKTMGYILIVIPYTIDFEQIFNFIVKECSNLEILPKDCPIALDITTISFNDDHMLKRCQEMAEKHNGKCLTTKYLNAKADLELQCEKNHRWISNANRLQQGRWCIQCFMKDPKTSITMEEHKYAADLNEGFLISTEYSGNQRDKLIWKCKEGHIFESSVASIRVGTWCSYCAKTLHYSRDPLIIQRNQKRRREIVELLKDRRQQYKRKK